MQMIEKIYVDAGVHICKHRSRSMQMQEQIDVDAGVDYVNAGVDTCIRKSRCIWINELIDRYSKLCREINNNDN